MTDTNDTRREFEAWELKHRDQTGFWPSCFDAYQAATERATAVERERCAVACEVSQHYEDWEIQCGAEGRQLLNDVATVIRQGGEV